MATFPNRIPTLSVEQFYDKWQDKVLELGHKVPKSYSFLFKFKHTPHYVPYWTQFTLDYGKYKLSNS